MAEYLGWAGKMFSNIRGFYSDMNPATLTGANDVIIIKQEDGTYKTSPWHIRFGKMGVFWAKENNVDVEINGQPVNLPMKLGTAGDAIFSVNFGEHALLNNNCSNSIRANNNNNADDVVEQEQRCFVVDHELQQPQLCDVDDSSFSIEESNFRVMIDMTEPMDEDLSVLKEEPTSDQEMPEETYPIPLAKMRCNSLPEIPSDDMVIIGETKALSDCNSDVEADNEDDTGCIVGSLPSRPTEFLASHLKNSSREGWQWQNQLQQVETGDNGNNNISNVVSQAVEEKKDETNQRKRKVEGMEQGIYLDQLPMEDPDIMNLYLYPIIGQHGGMTHKVLDHQNKDEDCRSDPGLPSSPFSAPHSPVPFEEEPKRVRAMSCTASDRDSLNSSRSRIDCKATSVTPVPQDSGQEDRPASHLSNIGISLCGGIEDLSEAALREKFELNKISFKQFSSNPALLNDPTLVVRIGGKFFKWAVASSMIMSLVAFQEPLPDDTRDNLMKQHMPQKNASHKRRWLGGWFSGREKDTTDRSAQLAVDSGNDSDGSGPLLATEVPPTAAILTNEPNTVDTTAQMLEANYNQDGIHSEFSEEQQPKTSSSITTSPTGNRNPDEDYAIVLTLNAKQIELMNLHEGHNEVTFSITTKYQGTAKCHCSVFLWNWCDRIVISDIDGTITKSDVLGQVLPIISSTWNWSQVGIANLYTLIHQNGYKFIYLSARAIGQAKQTRDYLRNVKQGEYLLPDGPLLLSPSSLKNAFHKEVIQRKPEEFKIKCLKNILGLFPASTANPFMAGFGNRMNDVFAYTTVGIPKERIFIVDTKGHLRIERSTTFSSSYSKLRDIVDQIFPPVAVDPEFSSFNYWREPGLSLSEDDALLFLAASKNRRSRKTERSATVPSGTASGVAK